MRTVKIWRSRLKPLISSLVLFGLGVTTCLMFIQVSQNEIDGPAVYTSSKEYQPPQQQLLTQQETPCDSNTHANSDSTKSFSASNNLNGESSENKISTNPHPSMKEVEVFHHSKRALASSKNEIIGDIIALSDFDNDPIVWVVTPTFYRPEQKPELTRLYQALLPVRNFVHWIVVEDISQGSNQSFKDLQTFMNRFSKIKFTLLKSFPPTSKTKIVGRPRGVGGRRSAIDWIRKHYEQKKTEGEEEMNGTVYFADDDNTYDSDIFRQIQSTKKVSMFPVGLVTDFGVSSPIVQNGKVVGFYDGWSGLRKFPVDMAGFAINVKLFLDKPDANMPWVAGYEEDELLKSLGVTIKDIQPLANNCTEILVWHTKATRHSWPKRPKTMKPGLLTSTNLLSLLSSLPQKSLAGPGSMNKDSGFSLINMIFGGL